MRNNGGWKGAENGAGVMPPTMMMESGGDVGAGSRRVCSKRERK